MSVDGTNHFDVLIVGGGLAGLVSAIALGRAGRKVMLLEKKHYPFHKVCGEYVSNEVLGYLQSLGFDPFHFGASNITRLRLSGPGGRNFYADLDLGAFGLSRYVMDEALAQLAIQCGTLVNTGVRVTDIQFKDNKFQVNTGTGEVYTSKFVIGSWGKRETLDKKLQRRFMEVRTSYMAVKYHLRIDYPVDEIGLDNYDGGYCGVSKIEGDRYNMCNFYRRPSDKSLHPSITAYQEHVAFKNPNIKRLFTNADLLLDEPVVINEICFSSKPPVEQHILMCGDSAGLITPLCGNGMSMAITTAKIATDLLTKSGLLDEKSVKPEARSLLETAYRKAWSRQFSRRLFWGRTIQGLFGHPVVTEVALRTLHAIPPLERSIVRATHGQPVPIN